MRILHDILDFIKAFWMEFSMIVLAVAIISIALLLGHNHDKNERSAFEKWAVYTGNEMGLTFKEWKIISKKHLL